MGLRVELVGTDRLRYALAHFAVEISDYGPLWDRFEAIMSETTRSWFDSSGDGTWAPLARSTLVAKEREGFPPDPLIRTGNLVRSFDADTTGDVFSWGTDDPVADYHEDGRSGSNPMPARSPLLVPPSPATLARLQEAAELFAEEAARKAGLL
jgi:phage gpG-like protein